MNRRQLFFFGWIILFIGGCDCEDHELLINEVPSIFLVNDIREDIPYIRIQFNENVETSSVILNESLTLQANSIPYAGSFMIDSNAILIPICELMCVDSSLCSYEIIVENIKNVTGQILDGDMDGNDGGSFIDTFKVTPIDNIDFFIGDFPITCIGEPVMLDAGPSQSYLWSTGDTSRTITVFNHGEFSVTLSDGNNCSAIATATVTPLMIMSLDAGMDRTICQGDTIQLEVTNGCQYIWRAFPPTFISDSTSNKLTVIPFVTTTYQVRSTNILGVEVIDEVTITIEDFFPNAGVDEMICLGDSIILNASGGINYQWTPTVGLSNPSIPNPIATPSVPTTYTIISENRNGCVAIDDVFIDVDTSCTFFVETIQTIFSDSTGTLVEICFSEMLDTSTLVVNQSLTFTDSINLVNPITSRGNCVNLFLCHSNCMETACPIQIGLFGEDVFSTGMPVIKSITGKRLQGNLAGRHVSEIIFIDSCNP